MLFVSRSSSVMSLPAFHSSSSNSPAYRSKHFFRFSPLGLQLFYLPSTIVSPPFTDFSPFFPHFPTDFTTAAPSASPSGADRRRAGADAAGGEAVFGEGRQGLGFFWEAKG